MSTGPLMVNGQPNPGGPGRYCPPRVCYCGGLGPQPRPGACAWWTPAPAVVAAGTAEAKTRRTRARSAA